VEVSLEPALRVVGRITQVRGRQGLPDAAVVWMQGGERRMARSDARGEFQITDAFPGPALVRVSHRGFSPAQVELTVPATGHADRAFELPAIDLIEAGSVSGRVVDADGDPVRGARVGVGVVPAFLPAGAELQGLVQSDTDGQFQLEDVPVGRVTLSAYSASLGRGMATGVQVRAGETTGPVEIELLGADVESAGDALASVAITLGEQQGDEGVEVVIVNVAAGSEAERAGLREGDLVFAVDGWAVRGMAEARRHLGGSEGSDVIVEVERADGLLSLDVRREAVRR
jgi:membrane-associated protease RseP (regulator of RpoE activity)